MKKLFLLLFLGLLSLFAACSEGLTEGPSDQAEVSDNLQVHWQTVSATEAYGMMTELDSFILLDVRTEAEFREARIAGAILLPFDEILDRAEAELLDKDAVILVYCQSGRRSAAAAADLAALGYTRVYDFGGIITWPYETVRG